VAVLENAATTATSLALASQQQWPNVVIPDYAERTSGLREIATGATMLVFSPVVEANRTLWEQFSVDNQGWTLEGHMFQGSTTAITSIPPKIHEDLKTGSPLSDFSPPPYSPVWQMSPVPDDLTAVNYDLKANEDYQKLEAYVDENRVAAISAVVDMADVLGESYEDNDDEIPRSIALQPIFSDLTDTSIIVGHYMAVVEWSNFFSDVLHEGANGVIVVLKNSCGQAFTYVVNGSEATFVGEGDQHDSDFNKYRRSAEIFDLSDADHDHDHDEGDEHCFYSVDVYPTQNFKDDYMTSDPVIYTAIVIAIMLGTAVAFSLYELLIQRRNKAVLEKVAKTNAIVSSLFPENVRDRLIHGDNTKEASSKSKDKSALSGKQGLKSFLDDAKIKDADAIGESKPIADLFPHTVCHRYQTVVSWYLFYCCS
jgi:hypothetical protein